MKKAALALVVLAAVLGPAYFMKKSTPVAKPYVFVNQTSDHRFDDSIRMTIFANQKRAGVQNAVVIAKSVPSGLDIEHWAANLFKELHLGQTTSGKAILYLYIPERNQMKIEVGYGLEGILPDASVRQLEEAAKSFTYAERMHDFWADLINTINVSVYNHQHELQNEVDFKSWRYLSGGAGISRRDYDFSAEQLKKEFKALPPGDSRFQAGHSAQETLNLYLQSLQEGIGDTNLPLLSTGSRLYRAQSPLNQALLQRMWKMYDRAQPMELIQEGDHAITKFADQNPVLPIFLFRTKSGTWLVHEPYSFSVFNRFENSMSVFQTQPVTNDHSLLSKIGLSPDIIFWGASPYTLNPLEESAFFARLSALEKQANDGSSEAVMTLADFYLFETWNYERALTLYSNGIKLEDGSSERLWRLLPLLIVSGHAKDFLSVHAKLTSLNPKDERLKRNNEFYIDIFQFPESDWISEI